MNDAELFQLLEDAGFHLTIYLDGGVEILDNHTMARLRRTSQGQLQCVYSDGTTVRGSFRQVLCAFLAECRLGEKD